MAIVASEKKMTTPEVAAELGIDESQVRRLAKAGKLPAEKHGRDWGFSREVVEWFKKLERPPGNPAFRVRK